MPSYIEASQIARPLTATRHIPPDSALTLHTRPSRCLSEASRRFRGPEALPLPARLQAEGGRPEYHRVQNRGSSNYCQAPFFLPSAIYPAMILQYCQAGGDTVAL